MTGRDDFAQRLQVASDFAATLVGLEVKQAVNEARARDYVVAVYGPRHDTAVSADYRCDRITLMCPDGVLVTDAVAG